MKTYKEFIKTKKIVNKSKGIVPKEINKMLFDFQKDIVGWALRKGKAAIFADCGLGKTPMQLEWARQVHDETGGDVLILAPLAVSRQTQREGEKFGIEINICREQSQVKPGINITNYEMLHNFEPDKFKGVVLDESSILKSFTGKVRTQIIEEFNDCDFKLACTATPAPNDFMELGNHAEFLGVMTRTEMLSTFFVHDGGDTSKWRLKGHAEDKYWQWLSSWAVVIRKPSDLGYEDQLFKLPELKKNEIILKSPKPTDMLVVMPAKTLQERRAARKDSLEKRVQTIADKVNNSNEQWLIWCDFNDESTALKKAIHDAVEVTGSDKPEKKESAMLGFSAGEVRVLVTKPSIAGFGMNWQNCHNMAFVGLSDSYEQYYQAIRRCWRFGQEKEVNVHIAISEREITVLENIKRKEKDALKMSVGMVEHTKELTSKEIKSSKRDNYEYKNRVEEGKDWTMYLGDCVEESKKIEDDSIGYSIFSPPFASLYTYTNSEYDMGNCKNHSEFYEHFKYLIKELYRITKPGRLLSFHCMNLPTSKVRDGYIGIHDFRGDLIKMFQKAGWIYHSEVVIWKDPVIAMQRTKALGLLHKTIRKDSSMSRQGIPDYLVTMRKPGENMDRISNDHESFPVKLWQRYASPVWMDINPSNTLQKSPAREHKDEKHICPLQLDVIERGVKLWSKPGDIVFSPFAGIGSEGYQSVKMGRKFKGIELKESYFNVGVENLRIANREKNQGTIFELLEEN